MDRIHLQQGPRLRTFQGADADIIRPTAKMVQAVVQASYDDDMTVRTRALELLQHQLLACPVDQEADKECTLEQAENSSNLLYFHPQERRKVQWTE